MKLKVILTLICSNEKESEHIYGSLIPDNRNIPRDLEFNFEKEGEKIKVILRSENIKRIRSTIDELLSLISSMEKL